MPRSESFANPQLALNPAAPAVRFRGFQREAPAPKRPSRIKQAVLDHRAALASDRRLEADAELARSDDGTDVDDDGAADDTEPLGLFIPPPAPAAMGSPVSEHVALALQRVEPTDRRACRAYVSQLVTIEFESAVAELLSLLSAAQAKTHRRVVLGLKETLRAVELRKAKAVVMAVNIEPGDALEALHHSVIDACHRTDTPVLFAHSRRSLAKQALRDLPGVSNSTSSVSVLDLQGFETQFTTLLDTHSQLRRAWIVQLTQRLPGLLNPRNETPLWIAAWNNACTQDVIQACRANGWSIDEPDSTHGHTPLMVAVRRGFVACALALVAERADAEARAFDGQTVMHLAAATPHMDEVVAAIVGWRVPAVDEDRPAGAILRALGRSLTLDGWTPRLSDLAPTARARAHRLLSARDFAGRTPRAVALDRGVHAAGGPMLAMLDAIKDPAP
ncbi:Selenocysteine insertion sequence-binding protein 2 [Polyrhizophydium stewartii]|uniref:Selenocysteine insertion sequence-binding protein 2 n=1 Tax=Polyrhizophydium stewartii TaxID=2732419 RepID=A0ABR4N9V4_9FUNG